MTRFMATLSLAAMLMVCGPDWAMAQVGKSVTIADANTAPEADLATLPHMNAATAKTLVAGRPFASISALDTLLQGRGLSRAQLTDLYGRLFVHINLNAATDAEIQLIPGVGARMLREFKEYRPYAALAVFHREIDKYVDDAELARLEQYVFVPMDLNSASDADLLTIPALGNRMLREFKEYRPYKAMDQFRREIGKYVSKEEVARFERYVTIK
jgi:DNA uptake protein ComE-like DNA-binding protein